MKIRLQNKIQFEEQIELVDQVYDALYRKKGEFHYLLFESEEKEKNILKFNEVELTLIRFLQAKTILHFVKEKVAFAHIPTPMGVQIFSTHTSDYRLYLNQQEIFLAYQLKSSDERQVFADYQMNITWS